MLSLEQFKHKANVLATSGFILATPLGMQITNWLLTGFKLNVTLYFTLPLMIFLAYIGLILLNRSLGLMKEIDGRINQITLC